MQIISLFYQLQFVFYKRLLSNTRNDLKGRRRKALYFGTTAEFKCRTLKIKRNYTLDILYHYILTDGT